MSSAHDTCNELVQPVGIDCSAMAGQLGVTVLGDAPACQIVTPAALDAVIVATPQALAYGASMPEHLGPTFVTVMLMRTESPGE